jgi:hypothetical protein
VNTQKRRGELGMYIEVETQNVDGNVTALGRLGPFRSLSTVLPKAVVEDSASTIDSFCT